MGIEGIEGGDELGWSQFMMMEMYWSSWLDFHHGDFTTDDGEECITIDLWQDPISIEDIEEYY